jgi:hypothetical protein
MAGQITLTLARRQAMTAGERGGDPEAGSADPRPNRVIGGHRALRPPGRLCDRGASHRDGPGARRGAPTASVQWVQKYQARPHDDSAAGAQARSSVFTIGPV